MSIGARPLRPGDVRAIIDRKMRDFRKGHVDLRHLDVDPFLEAARDDPDVRLAIDTGFLSSLEDDLRDPVLCRIEDRVVVTCPPLAHRVLADEPAEIHRAFVEGAFFRKLFRFFVPATHEGGEPWEATSQVREIMQRHFAFQLVAVETVLDEAS